MFRNCLYIRGYNLHLMQSREIKTLNYKLSTLNYT